MASKELLEHQLQEIKVLNAELASIRPNASLYERQVPSSNVFFLARDQNAVKSAAKLQEAELTKVCNQEATQGNGSSDHYRT